MSKSWNVIYNQWLKERKKKSVRFFQGVFLLHRMFFCKSFLTPIEACPKKIKSSVMLRVTILIADNISYFSFIITFQCRNKGWEKKESDSALSALSHY